MSAAEPRQRLTVAEYLQIEKRAEFKNEFLEGEMHAMSGGTPKHSLIEGNLVQEFGAALAGKPCVRYTSNLRVKVEATGLFTYPDLSVICGPLETPADDPNSAVNPTVLVEVLSKSTETYDRIEKFDHYRQIPSLRDYLLVSQDQPRVERYQRQNDGAWLWSVVLGTDAAVDIPSLGISLPMARIYARVNFAPDDPGSRFSPAK